MSSPTSAPAWASSVDDYRRATTISSCSRSPGSSRCWPALDRWAVCSNKHAEAGRAELARLGLEAGGGAVQPMPSAAPSACGRCSTRSASDRPSGVRRRHRPRPPGARPRSAPPSPGPGGTHAPRPWPRSATACCAPRQTCWPCSTEVRSPRADRPARPRRGSAPARSRQGCPGAAASLIQSAAVAEVEGAAAASSSTSCSCSMTSGLSAAGRIVDRARPRAQEPAPASAWAQAPEQPRLRCRSASTSGAAGAGAASASGVGRPPPRVRRVRPAASEAGAASASAPRAASASPVASGCRRGHRRGAGTGRDPEAALACGARAGARPAAGETSMPKQRRDRARGWPSLRGGEQGVARLGRDARGHHLACGRASRPGRRARWRSDRARCRR